MIFNSFVVLELAFCLLRLVFATIVACLALRVLLKRSRWSSDQVAQKSYLAFYSLALLVAFNILSWPLFYATLQSYVAHWPQVMCIYGVTKIGTGSLSVSRFLPELIGWVQLTKPALAVISGASGVLYLLNRSSQTSPLLGRVLGVTILAAGFSIVDLGLEATYLVIPKKEVFATAGCCSTATSAEFDSTRLIPDVVDDRPKDHYVYLHYGISAPVVLLLLAGTVTRRLATLRQLALGVGLLCLAAIPISGRFLVRVGAPAAMGLPFHYCAYDLIDRAPEAALGVAIHILSWCLIGWAVVAAWLGSHAETHRTAEKATRLLFFFAFVGQMASITVWSVELWMGRTG